MARLEYWLQLENRRWDASPWGINRLTGTQLQKRADGTFSPASEEALIIRRYARDWATPENALINAWDLTELSPAQVGGSIPGAVLEAKIADEIIVHFRNMDQRTGVVAADRIHSLHPHGVQRKPIFDGAYPLSPPDPAQGNRQGDRVAPGESFTYHWTCPQRAAAGAWLLRDHSLAGIRSTALGAFGVLIIRAPGEQTPDLPVRPVRQAADTAIQFTAVPKPPKRGEYLLVFHHVPGIGLCVNGRRDLGSTPALVAAEGTRMTIHCVNATDAPLAVHIHGHRWEAGDRWIDSELLPAHGTSSLSILSGSSENGGGAGEWLISGRADGDLVLSSLVVTAGGAVTLASA
jgi:hypothetical protein